MADAGNAPGVDERAAPFALSQGFGGDTVAAIVRIYEN